MAIEWKRTAPTEAGIWLMRCFESDFEVEEVKVELMRGELWAVDCEAGSLPVAMYHDGLTDCTWKRV
jgi:hypothetical protein